MIIAIAGQKHWKYSDVLEDGFIEMCSEPPSDSHYAIDGEWLLPESFM